MNDVLTEAKAAMLANILRIDSRDHGTMVGRLNAYAARQFEADIERILSAASSSEHGSAFR